MSAATLRDQFAIAALPVIGALVSARMHDLNRLGHMPEDQLAQDAFDIADAMLRARDSIPVGEAQESDFGGLGLGGIEP